MREYLSEDKSIEDIITYIRRNEKTYSLLSEWKDGEISSLFKSRGIEDSFNFCKSFDLKVDSFGNTYFTLPYKPCIEYKIVLLDADNEGSIHVENILWFEFYRTKEALCIEIFDDNCETTKITFSDFECKKLFSSGTSLSENCRSAFEGVTKLSSFINEKYEYDPALLNEYKLLKAVKILNSITLSDSERKKSALSKKLLRFFRSKKCIPFIEKVLSELMDSQKNTDDSL